MSTDPRLVLEVIPLGEGVVLDLGGGGGELREGLGRLGYQYVNLDVRRFADGEPTVIGDAHALGFRDRSFAVVISKDSLEHFLDPFQVVREAYRVLADGGHFVVWVPFMHPFHGDDTYRYSPIGLRHLLAAFEIRVFDSPLWVCTVVGLVLGEMMKSLRLGWAEPRLRRFCGWLDRRLVRFRHEPAAFAAAYRIVARKPAAAPVGPRPGPGTEIPGERG